MSVWPGGDPGVVSAAEPDVPAAVPHVQAQEQQDPGGGVPAERGVFQGDGQDRRRLLHPHPHVLQGNWPSLNGIK